MYAVVEFPKKECSIVPLFWLTDKNTKCYWPRASSDEQFLKLVKEQRAAKSTWAKYSICKIFYVTESFDDCELYLKKIIDQSTTTSSDVTSNENHLPVFNEDEKQLRSFTIKRVTTNSDRSISSDEEDEHELSPVLNCFSENTNVVETNREDCNFSTERMSVLSENISHDQMSSTKRQAKSKISNDSACFGRESLTLNRSLENFSSCKNVAESPRNTENNFSRRRKSITSSSSSDEISHDEVTPRKKSINAFQPSKRSSLESPGHRGKAETLKLPSCSSASSSLQSTVTVSSSPNYAALNNVNDGLMQETNDTFKEFIVRSLKTLETLVNQHTAKLDTLLRIQQAQLPQTFNTPSNLPEFPLKDKKDFKNIEHLLKNLEHFQYLKHRLSCVGGSNVRNGVMNMMKFLLTNKLAMKFNWAGRENKKPFKDSLLMKVIAEAARHSFSRINSQDCQDKNINDAVKDWLRLARSRYEYSQRKVPLQ